MWSRKFLTPKRPQFLSLSVKMFGLPMWSCRGTPFRQTLEHKASKQIHAFAQARVFLPFFFLVLCALVSLSLSVPGKKRRKTKRA